MLNEVHYDKKLSANIPIWEAFKMWKIKNVCKK